jgi:hypothetical protein
MKIRRMAGLALTATVWLALVGLSETTGLSALLLTGYAMAVVYVRERDQRIAWTILAVAVALLLRHSMHSIEAESLAAALTVGVTCGITARAVRAVMEQIESRTESGS